MGKKKGKKSQKKQSDVSPLAALNKPGTADAIQKAVQAVSGAARAYGSKGSGPDPVRRPETLGEHIKRLGVETFSVDINDRPCIAISVQDLVRIEMDELVRVSQEAQRANVEEMSKAAAQEQMNWQKERAADIATIKRVADQQEARMAKTLEFYGTSSAVGSER